MVFRKKIGALIMVSLFIIAGIAATSAPADHQFKNLKILPKDITMEQLDKVMDGFKEALGVKCGFCHAPSSDSTSHHLDFASDAKPEKNIARSMMKMTMKINKKYFSFNKNEEGKMLPTVECMTCHRGSPHPAGPKK